MTRASRLLSLDGEWTCRQFLGEEWRVRRAHTDALTDDRFWISGRVPGSVLHDAWHAGLVADPYRDRNSLLAEWVPERAWVYRRWFAAPPATPRAELRLEGLDPVATVFLNGEELGTHASTFAPARFEVGDRLRWDAENLLAVVLHPAPAEQPQVGRTSLVRHHKPRVTEGWDFSPRLPHQGITGHVSLWLGGPAIVRDVWIRTHGDAGEYHVTTDGAGEVSIDVAGRAGVGPQGGFDAAGLERWRPNGEGRAALHEAVASVGADGWSDALRTVFGVRDLRWVENPGAPRGARPYTVEVDGRRLWVRGVNWVPADVLYGVPHRDRVRHLLELAHDANVNLVRVWGGGLIESDDFYSVCDRLGLLVWQEFALSSSLIDNRPSADPVFLTRLEADARAVIPRLRSHPSLALWGGGNELTDADGKPLDESEPALAVLARTVAELDPDRDFVATSPSGPEFANTLAAIQRAPDGLHDVHGPWEHQGLEAQHTLWNASTSLFNGEFGCEGMPHLATIRRYVSEDLWPATRDNPAWAHRGDWWINEPAVQAAFGGIADLETLTRASQLLQAHGLRVAIESTRRRRPRNSGAVVWHLHEPFPAGYATSLIDYDGHPKPAYAAVARAYAPVLVAATLERTAWTSGPFRAEPWVSSFVGAGSGELCARLLTAAGEELASWRQAIAWPASGTGFGDRIDYPLEAIPAGAFFLDLWVDGVAAARYALVRGPDLGALLRLPPEVLETSPQKTPR